MIELDLTVPLAAFQLRVQAELRSRAVSVLGRSGSGKTTLLLAIAGLRAAQGRLRLAGVTLLDTAQGVCLPPELRRVGYVPQEALLFPHLSVADNLCFGRTATRKAVEEAVELLELGALLRRFPGTLSGGERQRVALGRALATAPRLLLLDEPLAAVDLELKERILPYLLRVRDEARVPLLYVTHNLGEAQVLSEECLVLERGQLMAQGRIGEALGLARLRAIDPGATFENVLDGEVRGGQLQVGQLRLSVPLLGLGEGARATFAVPGEDVLISTQPLSGISARNVLGATVSSLEASAEEALVRAEASGVSFLVRLTSEGARELELAGGKRIYLVVKTQSFRRLR